MPLFFWRRWQVKSIFYILLRLVSDDIRYSPSNTFIQSVKKLSNHYLDFVQSLRNEQNSILKLKMYSWRILEISRMHKRGFSTKMNFGIQYLLTCRWDDDDKSHIRSSRKDVSLRWNWKQSIVGTRVHTSRSIKRGFQRRHGTSVIFVSQNWF